MNNTQPEKDHQPPEVSVLFPDVDVRVRVGRWIPRFQTVRVRPFSIRQVMGLSKRTQSVIALATGKTDRWLRSVNPEDVVMLHSVIAQINAWSPQKLNDELGKDKQGKPYGLERCVAILIAAGHDPAGLLDYTWPQFMFFVREAIETQNRNEAVRAVLSADGVAAAIAASFSKEGARILEEFKRILLKKEGEA